MSSILKALRKLEEEKAAMGSGGVDIARDILKRSSSAAARQPSGFLLVAVFFGTLVATATGFWWYFSPLGAVPSPQVPIASTPAVSPQPMVLPAEPVDPPGSVAEIPVKVQPAPLNVPLQKPELPSSRTPQAPASAQPSLPLEPRALNADGLPFLKLTGIVYQKNPGERIAILNDLPVMRGTSIEGAEVVDIQPDRVVMQWRGQEFALRLAPE